MSYFNIEGVEKVEGVEKDIRNPNQYDGYQGSMSNHPMVYDDLIRLLNGESNSLASPEDGLRTVKAIEKIYSSIHVS
jgi:hypothetical protein